MNKTWDIWHCRLARTEARGARYYAYRIDGPRAAGPRDWHAFDPEKVLLDPYAKEVFFPPAFDREAARRPGSNAGPGAAGRPAAPPSRPSTGVTTGRPATSSDAA